MKRYKSLPQKLNESRQVYKKILNEQADFGPDPYCYYCLPEAITILPGVNPWDDVAQTIGPGPWSGPAQCYSQAGGGPGNPSSPSSDDFPGGDCTDYDLTGAGQCVAQALWGQQGIGMGSLDPSQGPCNPMIFQPPDSPGCQSYNDCTIDSDMGWSCMPPPGGAPDSAECVQNPGGEFESLGACQNAGCGGTTATCGICGDVLGTGGVTAQDASSVLQYVVGSLETLPCMEFADVNGDGQVNEQDAQMILDYVSGAIPGLPCGIIPDEPDGEPCPCPGGGMSLACCETGGGCPHPEATNYDPLTMPGGNPIDCSGQPMGTGMGGADLTCCEWPMMTCYKCSGISKPTLAVTTQQFPQFNNWGVEKSCEDYGNEWSEEVPDCDKGGGVSTLAPQKDKSEKAKRPTPQRDKKLREELRNFKRLIK